MANQFAARSSQMEDERGGAEPQFVDGGVSGSTPVTIVLTEDIK